MEYLLFIYQLIFCVIVIPSNTFGSHFRGGSISWKPTGNGREVIFNVKTGWVFSHCSGTTGPNVSLACMSGCTGTITSSSNRNKCIAADQQQNWSRAELVFSYTFPDDGPFTIAYSSAAWISDVGGGSWTISSTVNLATRSDTGMSNNSPVAASKPTYYIKYGCTGDIVIPVTDADGDNVRCRWSTGSECATVCYSPSFLPNVNLDEDTCTLRIRAVNKIGGKYAVALTIEDRPKSPITIGGRTYTPNDVISSTPMQFIFVTPDIPSRSCCDKPVFVTPTPLETDLLVCVAGSTISIPLYATSPNTAITSFLAIDPPLGMTQSSISQDASRTGVFFTILTWTPKPEDQGTRKLCVEATDYYLMSTQRCLTVKAWDLGPCVSEPCFNNGTCTRVGVTDDFHCACQPGYTSRQCHVDINECASNPCQHGGTCVDKVNGYQCVCAPGYTGSDCEIDINECASNPCQNGATCFDLIDEWFCGCVDGYTGINCETDTDECYDQPCENGGTCSDLVGSSVCDCIPGTYGVICQNGIDHCLSLPCENHGRCINTNDSRGYVCDCVDGWQGKHCAYRFENSTFGNKSDMLMSYMHYSDCNCKIGNDRQDRCYRYTAGKNAGFGVLGAILGVITSVLLYATYLFLIHTCDVDDEPMIFTKPINTVKPLPDEELKTSPECESSPVVEVVEEKPKGRQHKCWACDVKRNLSQAPDWYRQEARHYPAVKQSKVKRVTS